MNIKFYIFLSLFSTKRNCSATVSSAGHLSFNIQTEIEIACAFLQETLHKHNEDTVDNSVETVEESLADTDTEENGGGGCLKLFTNWPLMSSITLYCIFSLQDVAYAEVKIATCLLSCFSVVVRSHAFSCKRASSAHVITVSESGKTCRRSLFGLSVTDRMVD
jgi:hypothetical protein